MVFIQDIDTVFDYNNHDQRWNNPGQHGDLVIKKRLGSQHPKDAYTNNQQGT